MGETWIIVLRIGDHIQLLHDENDSGMQQAAEFPTIDKARAAMKGHIAEGSVEWYFNVTTGDVKDPDGTAA